MIQPLTRSHARTRRTVALVAVAAAVGIITWFFRFNDPGGSFAGLTDDHFFYVIRGWQIFFGDLPVRDFVDHGAPLFYYVSAAVQAVLGRGTLAELVFGTTAVAVSAALTYWIAAEMSGSLLAGLAGAAFHVLMAPRFYNYPKVLVYAVAIPLLWRFADQPSGRRRTWVAVVTVVGFLLRHDHGVFVAAAMAVLLLLLRLSWRERLRQAAWYGATVLLLLAPYLAFVERHGGVVAYFEQASEWAERDRDRAPVVWPGLFANPDGVSELATSGNTLQRAVATVRDNRVAWLFYTLAALPFAALAVLGCSRDAFRSGWPHARAKVGTVAVLGLVLDVGFLRSPLAARLADPSVPLAALVAWLTVALPLAWLRRAELAAWAAKAAWPIRVVLAAVTLPLAFVIASVLTIDLYDRLDAAAMTERVGKTFEQAAHVADQVRLDWQLESWAQRPDHVELIDLAIYLNACTAPTDRILMQAYLPQVLALSRRAFAGGHADLRPGFFGSEEAQRLTIARLTAQSVPLILLETGDEYAHFREEFPLVIAYIDEHYRLVGTREFDGRFGLTLFARRDRVPAGLYAPFDWPCFGPGVPRSLE